MKFKNLILCSALAMCFTANARVTGDNFTSSDSDGNRVNRTTISAPINADMAVGYSNTTYSNTINDYSADELKLILDIKRKDYLLSGEIGLGSMRSRTYLNGDLNYVKKINDNLDLTAGVYAGIVDSDRGLARGITVTGATVGAEVHNDFGGLVGSLRAAKYTNNNTQTGFYGKAYVNVADGVNVYVATKQYGNSRPSNGDYYSPNNYARYVVGAGVRKKLSDVIVSGYYEHGTARADGVKSIVNAWKVNADVPINKQWSAGATVGSDSTRGSKYRYNYAKVYVTYTF